MGHPVKLGYRGRVGDERESSTAPDHLVHVDAQLEGKVAQDGKDDEASEHRGEHIHNRDYESIPITIKLSLHSSQDKSYLTLVRTCKRCG